MWDLLALVDLDQAVGFVIGLVTMGVQWLAGSGRTSAWVLALFGNGLWLIYVFTVETWTLLPMVFCMTLIYIRNLRRGLRKQRALRGEPDVVEWNVRVVLTRPNRWDDDVCLSLVNLDWVIGVSHHPDTPWLIVEGRPQAPNRIEAQSMMTQKVLGWWADILPQEAPPAVESMVEIRPAMTDDEAAAYLPQLSPGHV